MSEKDYGDECAEPHPHASSTEASDKHCMCPSCIFHEKCGWEMQRERERKNVTCDYDCKHGRWYIHEEKLLCDRICIHTIDDFKCPFEQHDTTIRNETEIKLTYKAIKAIKRQMFPGRERDVINGLQLAIDILESLRSTKEQP